MDYSMPSPRALAVARRRAAAWDLVLRLHLAWQLAQRRYQQTFYAVASFGGDEQRYARALCATGDAMERAKAEYLAMRASYWRRYA